MSPAKRFTRMGSAVSRSASLLSNRRGYLRHVKIAGGRPGVARTLVNKKTKTKTATTTGTQKKYYLVDDRAGSITDYIRYQKSNIPRTMFKTVKALQPMIYNLNGQAIWTSTAGRQEFKDLIFFDIPSLSGMYSDSMAAATTTAIAGTVTSDIYVMSVKANFTFTNLSNGILEFDLYDWVARRDVYHEHEDIAALPSDCFRLGIKDQITGTGNNTDYQKIGITPFASKLFTMNYKVLRSRHIVLAPGQQHTHLVTVKPYFRVNEELISNASLTAIKKLTSGTSMLFRGGVVRDNSTGVTYAPAEVGVIASYQYKHKFIPVNWRYQTVSTNIATAVGATNNLENLVTGAAATYATLP